jgi:hypothetical protein
MRAPWIRLLGTAVLVTVSGAGLSAASCTTNAGGGTGSMPMDASATGIWSGTDSVSKLAVTALINSAGQAVFIRADGVQFAGTAQVSGNTLAAAVDGYTDFSATFSDGSNFGIGTLNGMVRTGTTLTATLTFTTHGGTHLNGNWSLSFNPRSNNASSTSAVSGNYTDNVTGTVLSISSSGEMTSQSATNGCVLNGTISTSDTAHDLYEVAFTYGNCTGTYAPLNGVQFSGLASLNSSLSPAQITLAVAGASATARYGIVASFNAG